MSEQKRKILIVDDNEDVIALLTALFQSRDGKSKVIPQFAMTGYGALSLLRSLQFSGLVIDAKLPDITGVGVVNEILQDIPTLPVALLTSYELDAVEELTRRANVFYWPKKEMFANAERFVSCVEGLALGLDCFGSDRRKRAEGCGEEKRASSSMLSMRAAHQLHRLGGLY